MTKSVPQTWSSVTNDIKFIFFLVLVHIVEIHAAKP